MRGRRQWPVRRRGDGYDARRRQPLRRMPTTYRRPPPATRSPNVASTSSDADVGRANTRRYLRGGRAEGYLRLQWRIQGHSVACRLGPGPGPIGRGSGSNGSETASEGALSVRRTLAVVLAIRKLRVKHARGVRLAPAQAD